MNRLYVNNWSSLGVGRSRYGILLREDGFVYDDGVVARTGPDRFHVTTTTGGAPRVLALMEDYRQTEWPELKVWLTSTTEQWAVIAVQGPNSRRVLETLVQGIDISAAAWPHMSVGRGSICGVPMLLFRVSFTGELGFEINVPADFGHSVWEAVYAAGQAFGITEYGTETMHVLRAEKGYIIIGQDTDGTVTPMTPDSPGRSARPSRTSSASARSSAVDEIAGSQAAGRPAHQGSRRRARGRRASGRNAQPEAAHEADRTRHLLVCQQRARPFHRPGRDRGRPRPHGTDAVCAHAGRRPRSRSHLAGLLRSHRSAHQCLILRRAHPPQVPARSG
jgi:glycine cleavage system aminomethyltransferase T